MFPVPLSEKPVLAEQPDSFNAKAHLLTCAQTSVSCPPYRFRIRDVCMQKACICTDCTDPQRKRRKVTVHDTSAVNNGGSDSGTFDSKPVFECTECMRHFKIKASMMSHLRHKHSKVFTSMKSKLQVQTLEASSTSPEEDVHQTVPSSPEESKEYQAIEHDDLTIETQDEGFQENEQTGIPDDREMKEHSEGNIIICKYCSARFGNRTKTQKRQFQIHLEIHFGLRPFPCHVCGKCFKTSLNILKHMTSHDKQYKLDCSICKMAFKTMAELGLHKKTCK